MSQKKSLNIKICGAAGEGIKSIGLLLSKSFVRAGYWTFDYTEYPSLIRGGHNTYQIHVALKPVHSQVKRVDILVAFNKETIQLHQEELTDESLVIFNQGMIKLEDKKAIGKYLPIPLAELAVKAGGLQLMANNAALGAVAFFTGFNIQILKDLIKEIFDRKGSDVVQQNQKTAQAGYDYAQENFSADKIELTKPENEGAKISLTGNEAISLGAIAGGMKFYAAYPMTPATSILHYLASRAKDYNLLVKHAEDEISVINMALGASFAGVRAMIGTSGGGFALMSEALGMAGIMELPLVVVEGMRTGPSTGMPTWHDQGDLRFVLHASQGEFPRVVMAPGDITEHLQLAKQAFYFAEKYQLPVIILTDKYMAESAASVFLPESLWENQRYSFQKNPPQNYKRYQKIASGVSLRTIPGQANGEYLSNSYEHDELGFATEEINERILQVEKRARKFEALQKELADFAQPIFGNPDSEIALISWGSNKGPIIQALEAIADQPAFLNLNMIWPFPEKQVGNFLKSKKTIIDIECNSTAQLAGLIREQTGIEIKEKLLKYDGRPFYPEEIRDYLLSFRTD